MHGFPGSKGKWAAKDKWGSSVFGLMFFGVWIRKWRCPIKHRFRIREPIPQIKTAKCRGVGGFERASLPVPG